MSLKRASFVSCLLKRSFTVSSSSSSAKDLWSEEFKEDDSDLWNEGLSLDTTNDLWGEKLVFEEAAERVMPSEQALPAEEEEEVFSAPVLVTPTWTASVEQLPDDVLEYELAEAIREATGGHAPRQVDMFWTNRRRRRNALVTMQEEAHLETLLTPNRLAFGLHLGGQRCPLYNAHARVRQLVLKGLPRRESSAAAFLEEALREVIPPQVSSFDIRIPRRSQSPDQHRGVAIVTLDTHDEARATLQSLRQSALNTHYASFEFGVAPPPDTQQQANPYHLMLHQVRARIKATEEENARLRAALEKATANKD